MTRAMILVVGLTGACGLAIGWWATAPRPQPLRTTVHETLKPPAADPSALAVRATAEPLRVEFALRPEDVANDRETPALAVDAEGRVVLAWASQTAENERTIHVARSSDGGKTFESPTPFRKVPIYRFTSQGKGKTMAFSTHVLPRLVATADGLFLSWVEAIQGGPEVVNYVARSRDGGKTFSDPIRVHGKEASRPGFTTFAAAPDGTLLAAWLDGRNKGQQPFFAAKSANSEGFEPERLVYAGSEGKGICPCCDLAALRLPDGSDLVAFRNSDAGHRDIWFARGTQGGAFAPPTPLSLDNWTFEGCPHDGPSLALDGDRVFAVWMSAHSGKNRVYAAQSPVSDLTFHSEPLSTTTTAQGHPKVALAGPGRLYVAWDESLGDAAPAPAVKEGHGHGHHGSSLSGSGRAVMLVATMEGTKGFGEPAAVSPRAGVFQLNPAIAVGRDGSVLVAWNEIDTSGKRVVLVRRGPEKTR